MSRFPTASISVRPIYSSLRYRRAIPLTKAGVCFPGLASLEFAVYGRLALADALGGVVACTRPLVEENIFDAKQQIGLSGRTVKPKLIICLGISGAVQFAAGMKSSDCIIAINTDPHAPIFDVAHYGIVGDLNAIVPLLLEKINAKENGHV